MSDSGRAVIFGDDAVTYDLHRPGYPAEAIAHILGLVTTSTTLEVGAGTGKATADIARDGLDLICLEPSPAMAETLRGKNLPGVEVVEASFEDWQGPKGSFDLIYAAQAWHWVDRSTAYAKALRLLRPGGALALMWNIPKARYAGFEHVYSAHAPHLLAEHDERIKRRDTHDWTADMTAAGFGGTGLFTHDWSERLTASGLPALYSTYSDHMMLPEPTRSDLLAGLEATVARMGGATVEYRTVVFTGRSPR